MPSERGTPSGVITGECGVLADRHALSLAGPAPIASEAVQAHNFAKLTFAEARRLDGKAVRVRFVPESHASGFPFTFSPAYGM